MRSFADILAEVVATRGADVVETALAAYKRSSVGEIENTSDDRVLAAMAQRIFSAGFSQRVIAAKWPGFENAFFGFDPGRCGTIDEAQFDGLLNDARIVRNAAKVLAVKRNAQWLLRLSSTHGSAARWFARWPDEDYVGLLEFDRKIC